MGGSRKNDLTGRDPHWNHQSKKSTINMEDQNEKLFNGFPLVSTADWEARIKEDLKGADYEKKLVWKSLENIRIKPYYTAEDLLELPYIHQLPGQYPFIRGNKTGGNDWEIRQDFRVFDIDTTLQKALMAVERGATSIGFDLTAKGDLYFHDFRKLIAGFAGKDIALNFMAGEATPDILDYLLKALDELGIPSTQIKGSLGYDPLGRLTRTGAFYNSAEADFKEADRLLLAAENELSQFRVFTISSHLFSDSGSNIVQELAFGLSMAAEYFTRLTAMGHSAADIAVHMQWNLGAGPDYFMEIAKVRAARLLFSGLLSAFDNDRIKNTPVFIHSITTDWNKTLYDPNVNMLRLTTEAMAAILGGCNSLLVKPYDSWYREPGDFSERIARNIQIILKEESYFDKVVDPSAGSYYIEALTDSLVESAWQLFLKTDESGGYSRAFMDGFIRDEVNKTVARRREMVSTRREVLVGTNHYPNQNEEIREEVDPDIAFARMDANPGRLAEPLLPGRAAEAFEKLRLAVEKHPGGKPKVFMLTYGHLAKRLARSQFSSGFFACAGYEVIDNLGFASAKDGVDAALQAGAKIIVVCSSDEEYSELVPEVARLVGNKAIVVVAGAPPCIEELKQKGISEFIHVKSNVLETLQHFHVKLGI
jgi:methylmalonyl-CoA mutase